MSGAARPLPFLTPWLDELRQRDLLRTPHASSQRAAISLCSNDYLGLARNQQEPSGATGSRLISGDHAEVRALEQALAEHLQVPSTLVFSSGYAANVGALSALLRPGDVVCSDALNHASLIDGIRLSRAQVRVFAHNDLNALAILLRQLRAEMPATSHLWVVTESYFSMDADGPDLPALRALCDEHGAYLYLDEAHAFGLFGPRGAGLAAEAGVRPDVLLGALGKAVGAQGAFVAGCAELRLWLWNRARSFVFSTGIAPSGARSAQRNLQLLIKADAARARLLQRSTDFRRALAAAGIQAHGFGPIVPILVGPAARAVTIANALEEAGFHVQPIRPPTVPPAQSRLRVTLSLHEKDEQLQELISLLAHHLSDP